MLGVLIVEVPIRLNVMMINGDSNDRNDNDMIILVIMIIVMRISHKGK